MTDFGSMTQPALTASDVSQTLGSITSPIVTRSHESARPTLAIIMSNRYRHVCENVMHYMSPPMFHRLWEAAIVNSELFPVLNTPDFPKPQVRCQNVRGQETGRSNFACRPTLSWSVEEIYADLKVCEGYKLGLTVGIAHGDDFMVCVRCNDDEERYCSIAKLTRAVTLCWDCYQDRLILRSSPLPTCRCEQEAKDTHLCHDCRVEYRANYLADVVWEADRSLPVRDRRVPLSSSIEVRNMARWIEPNYSTDPKNITVRAGCPDCGKSEYFSRMSWHLSPANQPLQLQKQDLRRARTCLSCNKSDTNRYDNNSI